VTLDSKVEEAQQLILDHAHGKPILAMSFGKDSMVMLDISRRAGLNLPVVYWKRERFYPLKNKFANLVTELYNLEVHDFPPATTSLIRKGEKIEVVNYFSISTRPPLRTLLVPSGIVPPDGPEFLCALNDMYNKPKGYCEFPWDTLFAGHKDTDVDPLQGLMPLKSSEVKVDNGATLCFPIRFFTDEDIWEYTRRFDVPQDLNRYKEAGEDLAYNNDYYPACTACINPDNPAKVYCPKSQQEIENVSAGLNWVDSIRPEYWKEL
jgi:3'-phosphoadenosine 5'-phosphosulfate sulfotransferase (PAPS reductase)/FAD synthetase